MKWYKVEFKRMNANATEEFVCDFINLINSSKYTGATLYEAPDIFNFRFVICINDHPEIFERLLKKNKGEEYNVQNISILKPVFGDANP